MTAGNDTVLWRTGRSVGRTVYVGDTLVGMFDTPELARQAVDAVNVVLTNIPHSCKPPLGNPTREEAIGQLLAERVVSYNLRRQLMVHEANEALRQRAYAVRECVLCGSALCAHRERWDFGALYELAKSRGRRLDEMEREIARMCRSGGSR
jgi:hypothetical protein